MTDLDEAINLLADARVCILDLRDLVGEFAEILSPGNEVPTRVVARIDDFLEHALKTELVYNDAKSYMAWLKKRVDNMSRDEAERWLLGAMLLSPESIQQQTWVREYLIKPGPNRLIHDAMENMAMVGQTINVVTVAETLDRRGQLEEVGGTIYLVELQSDCPMIGWADRYESFLDENRW